MSKTTPPQLSLFSARHLMVIDPALDDQPFLDELLTRIDETTSMARYAAIGVSTVLSRLDKFTGQNSDLALHDITGLTVASTYKRLEAFAECLNCVRCGRKGNVFLVEHHANDEPKQYLNLYSFADGELTLMTVDHILPDSWYGRADVDNFQTMCRVCNQLKQHVMTLEEIEAVRADITRHAKSWVDVRYLDLLLQVQKWYHLHEDAKVKAALWKMMERWRRRVGHTTQKKEIDAFVVELAQELDDTMLSFTGKRSRRRRSGPTRQRAALPASTKASWKQRMKEWFASAALAVAGLSRTHLSSRNVSPYRKLSKRSASVLEQSSTTPESQRG